VAADRARSGSGQQGERNHLLRSIPPEEYERIRPLLEPMQVKVMDIYAEPGDPVKHVYFPGSSVISLMRKTKEGALVENGTIGREGMAGLEIVQGVDWALSITAGEVPGDALRMSAREFGALLPELPQLELLLRRYGAYFLSQVAQTLTCNSMHPVEQRCARWLLMTQDRVGAESFLLTHEVLSQMLAVRRAGVTESAVALQRAGYIKYSRGNVRVLDRAGLESAACECYGIVRKHRDRLLGALED
jgi:CRP-like cAMP-binding protein